VNKNCYVHKTILQYQVDQLLMWLLHHSFTVLYNRLQAHLFESHSVMLGKLGGFQYTVLVWSVQWNNHMYVSAALLCCSSFVHFISRWVCLWL